MTRGVFLLLILFAWAGSSGCGGSLHSQQPTKWAAGFWYWHGNSAEAVPADEILDVLYVHAGTIWRYSYRTVPDQWSVSGDLPGSLPPAREYWLVFRQEEPGIPDLSAARPLTQRVVRLLEAARKRQLKVAGVQFDIDCPTARLPKYADFLREVRKTMPAGLEISITALLDWFRGGAAIAEVIRQTDEFVPQFYDIRRRVSADDGNAIAAKIDAAEWAPAFNRFGKRFRIGVSTFGRARLLPKEDPSQTAHGSPGLARIFGDLAPLDVAGNPAFRLQTSRSEARELVLEYRALREAQIGYTGFQPGDRVQFMLATPETIRAAVAAVRQIGGQCAGVIFFRWPAEHEVLVMGPDETLAAAGFAPARPKAAHLEPVNGQCSAVSCVDLYLVDAQALSPNTIRYRVRSSVELEYFLPEKRVPVRMAGAAEIEVTFPPYGTRNRLLLGRAVTGTQAEFRVEEEP